MDMIDILGGILGQKTSKSGRGSDVLKDMFGREQRGQRSGGAMPTAADIAQQSRELEDMLNVANERSTAGRSSASQPAPSSRYPSSGQPQPTPRRDAGHGQPSQHPSGSSQADHALVLVRAMVNAAKADGQVDQTEQQNILQRLSDRSPETIDFLRKEFAQPLNVAEFVRTVPMGMEQQVYMLSLITMDLDTSGEAQYLTALADGLRISPEQRNQIHARVGAPSIY